MLSAEQLDDYYRNGFLIPNFRFPMTVIEEIRAAHTRFVEKFPEFIDYCPALLDHDLSFLNYARFPDVLDMVAQILGDDISLWNSSLFAKPARKGRKTPWHQDGEYWPIRPLATCTVWIALDDSTVDNGCLRVIPGSHADQRLARHQTNDSPDLTLNQELQSDEFDASQAVDLQMEAGQISLHDVFLAHGSEANRSARPRRGMTLRYMPTTSLYDRAAELEIAVRLDAGDPRERSIFLVRGVDRHGGSDFALRGGNLI